MHLVSCARGNCVVLISTENFRVGPDTTWCVLTVVHSSVFIALNFSIGEEYKQDMEKWGHIPEGTVDVGKPEEIAALVSHLVSKEARYITGLLTSFTVRC